MELRVQCRRTVEQFQSRPNSDRDPEASRGCRLEPQGGVASEHVAMLLRGTPSTSRLLEEHEILLVKIHTLLVQVQ